MKEKLKHLCEAKGVAGSENAAAAIAQEMLSEYTDDVKTDVLGNVIGIIKSEKEGAKTLLFDAHIDEIGLMVVAVDDKGYLKVAACGGVDRRLLAAQEVLVHCKDGDILGIIGSKPPHLEKGDEAKQVSEIDDIFIDIGMSEEQALKKVSLGDSITIRSRYLELANNRISTKALDDRAGVVSILEALELLKNEKLNVNLAIAFSTREELGCQGAKTSTYGISPDMAIAVDVSFAMTPDAEAHKCGKMGEGVMISISPFLDKAMSDKLISLAKEKEIKYQLEVSTGRGTGTNADSIICTKEGVRTGILSIPIKYMHTPIELVQYDDIEYTAKLLAEYAKSL